MMDHALSLASALSRRQAPVLSCHRAWVLDALAWVLFLLAAPTALGCPQEAPIRVACVGDSITEGSANAEHAINSWPQVLGRMLEQQHPGRYVTANFGHSGATLLRQGRRPYWDQIAFERSREFQPQHVIVNLGSNDATRGNWLEHGEEFEQDLRELIEVYRGLESRPTVWLSNLTPMFAWHPSTAECAPHRVPIVRTITDLAAEYDLEVIDFARATAGRPELFPDGLHPNTAGNELLAMAAYAALTDEVAPRDTSLRPRDVDGTRLSLLEAGRGAQVHLGSWSAREGWVEGTGARRLLLSRIGVGSGDFELRARLRMLGQKNSAACFVIGEDVFGFEGARGTVFRSGPRMGGLRLLYPSEQLWEREAWIDFEVIRNAGMIWFLVDGFVVDMAHLPGPIERLGFDPTRSVMQVSDWSLEGDVVRVRPEHLRRRTKDTPWVDLSRRAELRTEVAGEAAARSTASEEPRAWGEAERLGSTGQTSGAGNTLACVALEGGGWGEPFELPASLTGHGHRSARLPDGRMIVSFVDGHPSSPTEGDLVAWVGSLEDLLEQREGDFTCRLLESAQGGGDVENSDLALRADGTIDATCVVGDQAAAEVQAWRVSFDLPLLRELLPTRGYEVPLIDLDGDEGRHVVVDREAGQYLGHVSTELLEDGRTILATYPKGHGKGEIVYKRSPDGGRTWSERLPTPASWSTSREVPTIHRVIDPETGAKRLILWSGLYPARLAHSEDDGVSWSELEPVGEWGGIVVMGFVERLKDGSYLAMFHDDGRFIREDSARVEPTVFTLYQTFSHDGGLSWSEPEVVWSGSDVHLCEPGCVRSPDGETLAVLLRENSRTRNSYVIFSRNEGETWSAPRELPASLTGDRHTPAYGPDGRLFISFRDTSHESPTQGDWVGWVGTWEDLLYGLPGQYRVRFKDNKHRWDTTYPGVEVLPDGTFVVTTYGHWDEGESPYILSARFTLEELDARAAALPRKTTLFERGQDGVHTYRIPALVTTNEGTLIACCDARRPSSRDLPNHIETVIRRSSDGGQTWGEVQTILAWPETEGAADPCLLVDRETGRVWCAVTWAEGVDWRSSKPGFGRGSFHDLLLHSDDDGETWSEPRDVTEVLKHPAWRSAWFSPGAGLQTRSGRLLLPFSAADAEGVMHSYAAVSDDHGETWRRVGPMGSRTNECMLAQLEDGTLVCNMRSTQGLGQRAVSLSQDDGETWTALVHDEQLIEPVCQGSLLTVPAGSTPDGGEWLVFCNPASTKRERLTVRVSFDGGETWPVERVVQPGPAAYSCMTLLPDGGVGLLYEGGVRGAYEGLVFATLPLTWLSRGGH